jgi:glycosyltransferase involved in cell wall biosynthesis
LAVLAWLLRNLPLVTTMIVPNPHKGETIPQFMMIGIQQLLASASDMIIVNGENLVELVQARYGISPERVLYVPLSARSMATPWTDETLSEEPGTVLFFGRATPHKGLEYLVRAQPLISEQLPDARILISAHGPELARCRQLIEDHDKFEINEGIVPGDVMAAYYRRASVVALPYLSAASSGVLMTAYNFGKPVVASDISGLAEYIKGGETGLLVPPTDIKQLADAIVRLLTDDALRQCMGQNAQRWIDERQEHITELTLEAYERALARYSQNDRESMVKETAD